MKVQVIRKVRLTDIIRPEQIQSVVERLDLTYNGNALAVALRCNEKNIDSHYLGKAYQSNKGKGGVYFIKLDNFTYHIPSYLALDFSQYKDVVLYEKEMIDDEGHKITYIRATITTKVKH